MNQGMNCPMCGAHMNSQEEMQEHEKMHKGQDTKQPMKCPMCGAAFNSKEEMDNHAKEAHGHSV